MRIASIGEVMVELLLHDLPGTAFVSVAGDAFNTATYLRKALAPQHEVAFVTGLGTDRLSDQIRAEMRRHNLSTRGVRSCETRFPGLYSVEQDELGERSFTYWRSESAARRMFGPSDAPDFGVIAGYDVVFFSGISLAILEDPVRIKLLAWLSDFARNGGTVAFDSNYRPRLWESRDLARSRISEAWSIAGIALPSLDDEMELFDQSEQDVCERFRSYSSRVGALKRGGRGPLLIGHDPQEMQDYPDAAEVVDTTAAGDSFDGTFLAEILMGSDPRRAAKAAHHVASQVIGKPGAIVDVNQLPTTDD